MAERLPDDDKEDKQPITERTARAIKLGKQQERGEIPYRPRPEVWFELSESATIAALLVGEPDPLVWDNCRARGEDVPDEPPASLQDFISWHREHEQHPATLEHLAAAREIMTMIANALCEPHDALNVLPRLKAALAALQGRPANIEKQRVQYFREIRLSRERYERRDEPRAPPWSAKGWIAMLATYYDPAFGTIQPQEYRDAIDLVPSKPAIAAAGLVRIAIERGNGDVLGFDKSDKKMDTIKISRALSRALDRHGDEHDS